MVKQLTKKKRKHEILDNIKCMLGIFLAFAVYVHQVQSDSENALKNWR